MAPKHSEIDGQNILYHYFQKNISKDNNEFSRELLERLLVDLAVWLPRNLYERLPIILPYVVRDPSCRPRGKIKKDEWGAASEHGFLRDDNSLIKDLPESFEVSSTRIESYNNRKIGNGFVASHIWREVNIQGELMISSRHHMLNSFVPNLVWLPVQISKLTDREGSYAQRLLQAISYRIYRGIGMPEEILRLWGYLPFPQELNDLKIDVAKLNYFDVTEKWLEKRIADLNREIDQIFSIDKPEDRPFKIKCQRYTQTLPRLPAKQRTEMNEWLIRYKGLLLSLKLR